MIKKPEIAGAFYPGNPTVLQNQINKFLRNAPVKKKYKEILGIISPHAGYTYSGQSAAFGFNAIKQKDFDLAVIIAPSHRFIGFEYSVGNWEAYETPLGQSIIHTELTEKLLEFDGFEFIPSAYDSENSLEVQIPFVQSIKPDAKIITIIIGNQSDENSSYLAQNLSEIFKDRLDKTVFIASSDLSHYHNSKTAIKMDTELIDLLLKKDIDDLYKNIRARRIEACGYGPILTLMYMADMLEFDKIEKLNYTHSGEITYDNAHVVGYFSGIVFK